LDAPREVKTHCSANPVYFPECKADQALAARGKDGGPDGAGAGRLRGEGVPVLSAAAAR